jgi:hypothetical protein
MFAALNATWGTIPGVTFTDVGECAGAAFDMSVTFTNDAFGGSCGRGVGNCAVNGPDMDVSANAQSTIQGVAVHEIGHGMGLLHEHQMPGAPPLCPYEKGILDSCRSCIAASDMGTPCAVSHYKGCFGKTIVIAHILDGNERATAQRYIDDRATVSDAKVLTTYDPLSIMDYCNYTNGRDRTDFTATALDRLGMEMLYPSTRTYGIGCGGGCLYSGDGVILRSNGAITSEWAARGAAGITMTWGAFVGASIPASLLPSDRSSLTYTFPEPRGTTRTGSGYVNKTDSLHGAIVSSLLVL